MDDLIKALQIFRKYGNPAYPTHCEHDIMHVMIEIKDVSDEDIAELERLGFDVGSDVSEDHFYSFKFGSA